MNTENIIKLSEQLKALGFEDLGYILAKRICFKPRRFTLDYRVEKDDNVLNCQLSFETDSKFKDGYMLAFYDAIFQRARSFEGKVNEIDVSLLSRHMSEIDWKKAFDFTEKRTTVINDKNSFDKEIKIETIIDHLKILESTDEGKYIASFFKQSYWSGAAYQNIYANIAGPKNKDEVSQRFYVLEEQPGITVVEAYRYLQNRWLEKEMVAKKKQIETANNEGDKSDGHGTGLLKKRRRKRQRVSQSEK